MKLREISIKNFRGLVDVTIPIDDFTVIVGENNAGKTSLLDALRICLNAKNNRKSPHFDEYDYYLSTHDATPETAPCICIELLFREDSPEQWRDELLLDRLYLTGQKR